MRQLAVLAVGLLAMAGCAQVKAPGPSRGALCAQLFDQLDGLDWLPAPTAGFDFRQMQLARIRQKKCLTFTRDLAGMEAGRTPEPRASGSAPFPRARAVQAGVLTNAEDTGRGVAYFAAYGFRSRAVGYAGLGTRLYVEAHTPGDIERVIDLAWSAGFVGPYPSGYVLF